MGLVVAVAIGNGDAAAKMLTMRLM